MKIGLISPCGWGNLGDAAIQESVLKAVYRRFPDAKVIMLTLNPLDTEVRHGVESFPLTPGEFKKRVGDKPDHAAVHKSGFKKYLKQVPYLGKFLLTIKRITRESLFIPRISEIVKSLDCLIVSGGGQLNDYWGGPWGHPFTLMKWSISAKRHRVPVMFLSVGAGPLNHTLSRLFVKIALSCGHYRSFRDHQSHELIENLGFKGESSVKPDLAFSFVTSNPGPDGHKQRKPLVVGVSPFAYFDPRVWPEKDASRYHAYLQKISQIVYWLHQSGYQVHFFPTQYRHDIPVIKDLLTELEYIDDDSKTKYQTHYVSNLENLLHRIQKMDLVIASRLHGVILSQCMLKPVLAISYHPKVATLMQELDMSDYCVDINEFDADLVKAKLKYMIPNRFDIIDTMEQKLSHHKNLISKQFENIFLMI